MVCHTAESVTAVSENEVWFLLTSSQQPHKFTESTARLLSLLCLLHCSRCSAAVSHSRHTATSKPQPQLQLQRGACQAANVTAHLPVPATASQAAAALAVAAGLLTVLLALVCVVVLLQLVGACRLLQLQQPGRRSRQGCS